MYKSKYMSTRLCPKCRGKLYVIRSKTVRDSQRLGLKHQYRLRRLSCQKCGYRTTTHEIDERDFNRWVEKERAAKKIIEIGKVFDNDN